MISLLGLKVNESSCDEHKKREAYGAMRFNALSS